MHIFQSVVVTCHSIPPVNFQSQSTIFVVFFSFISCVKKKKVVCVFMYTPIGYFDYKGMQINLPVWNFQKKFETEMKFLELK